METLPGTSPPHSERFLESSFTGCALLDCQDRTPAIVIDDWNIEPGSAIEQFSIPLYILFGRRKADKEHPGGYLHVGDRERCTARLFRLLPLEIPPNWKSVGTLNTISIVWLACSILSVLGRSDIVMLMRRSGISS